MCGIWDKTSQVRAKFCCTAYSPVSHHACCAAPQLLPCKQADVDILGITTQCAPVQNHTNWALSQLPVKNSRGKHARACHAYAHAFAQGTTVSGITCCGAAAGLLEPHETLLMHCYVAHVTLASCIPSLSPRRHSDSGFGP